MSPWNQVYGGGPWTGEPRWRAYGSVNVQGDYWVVIEIRGRIGERPAWFDYNPYWPGGFGGQRGLPDDSALPPYGAGEQWEPFPESEFSL